MNPTTGVISLIRDIVESDIGTFEFYIRATDGGDTPLSSSAEVSIRIANCTEDNFVFTMPYYFVEVDEGDSVVVSLALRDSFLFDTDFFPEPPVTSNPFVFTSREVSALTW